MTRDEIITVGLQIVTVDDVVAISPYCDRERIRGLLGDDMPLVDVAALDIPIDDRLFVADRGLPEWLRRAVACGYAERVLPIYELACPGDTRVRECLAMTRAYLRGEATCDDLRCARRMAFDGAAAAYAAVAAVHAAAAAAYTAVDGGAYAVGVDAAHAASCAAVAAYAAERQWQAGLLVAVLRGEVDPMTSQIPEVTDAPGQA